MENGEDPVQRPKATAELARLAAADYVHPPRRRRVFLPLVLFVATCASTFWVGAAAWRPEQCFGQVEEASRVPQRNWQQQPDAEALERAATAPGLDFRRGLIYMAAVLGILLAHEMGHFLTAMRHKIPASLPFFIPVPLLPFGTMGAVICMRGSQADRRQLFDLGIAGPLAGLMVALPITCVGIQQLDAAAPLHSGIPLHSPLIFRLLIGCLRPELPTDSYLYISQFNPLLMAGWVGMLVTGLNMVPISQLDGGHVAYGLFGRRAHLLARGLVMVAIAAVLIWEAYAWVVMLTLVILMGVDHPPTAEDRARLGWPRRLIGWASLAIPIVCLPPMRIP
ncbi:MAG: hypothetical protein A2V70_09490 [Planctomycetes bacterium RBG_13_63_9]|nr:MAG: hypothetical protein A2V70_09490 [Planctomycetes bacterium RBG_13_63_9]